MMAYYLHNIRSLMDQIWEVEKEFLCKALRLCRMVIDHRTDQPKD